MTFKNKICYIKQAENKVPKEIKYMIKTQNVNDDENDTDKLYNYLLTHWDENVSNFKLWLRKVCGVGYDSDLYIELDYLIKSENELNDFIEVFNGNIDDLHETTEKYKDKRFKLAGQATVPS